MLALLTENNFESGSNEHGGYIKFPDGTLIQYGSLKIDINSNNTTYASKIVKYPITASVIYYISLTNVFTYSERTLWSIGSREIDGFNAYGYNYDGYSAGQSADANWLSIGRWK